MTKHTLLNSVLLACLALIPGIPAASPPDDDDIIVRGEYLTRAANCMGCHTARGQPPYAGGRRLDTEFGTFVTPNLTPHPQTGLGGWTEEDFWQAMHLGRRPDGSALYPACPYPSFTHVHREDASAIYAYLQSLPPAEREHPEHDLRFPASIRGLLRTWQRFYFQPGAYEPDPDQSDAWNRGAYLVKGLGHCMVCHAERNRFGATRGGEDAPGGHVQGWYAPSLHSSAEAGLQAWPHGKGARLLGAGKAGDASMMGPMADVVYNSLQHLTEADIDAMTEYLRSLPERETGPSGLRQVDVPVDRVETIRNHGRRIYENSCMDCHGENGQGTAAASALAGNRAVTLNDPTNVINVIRHGGYPPGTDGNTRPFGMPPFNDLSAAEIAAVATYIRTSWDNNGTPVSSVTVERTQ